MKKSLLLFFALLLNQIVFSQASLGSDISIYRDISQSFENKYYPGTIEKVNLLQEKYPDSVFIQPALVYKATALVNLQCYEDAVETLKNAISHMHTGKPEFTQCHFLLGKSYFYLENYEESLKYFHTSCKLAKLEKTEEIYSYGIFYSAESYYNLGNYKEAYKLYEYVIENGNFFTKEEYEKSVQNLMLSYNKTNLYKKTINLYDNLDLDFFTEEISYILKLYAAEACERSGNYNKAYELYCHVIKSKNEDLAVIGLKNAFHLSESKKINVNPGEIFAQSENTFNNPEFVNEFWIRLGIDEYEKKNYEKALEYFSKSEKNFPIINIYKAKIILDTDDTEEGGKKAWKILTGTNIRNSDVENIWDTYYSLMLQAAVQQEKWNAVPGLFRNIKNPDEKSVYIYYSYLYKKEEYGKLPPESEVLYASGLCRQGKYQEAAKAFEILDENGRLDEEYLAEYGKTLFILGKYDEAYEITARSSDSQKQYILGLCKINTENYNDAKNHFNNYIREMSNNKDFNNLAFYYKGYSEYSLKEYKNAYASFVRFSDVESENDKEEEKLVKSTIFISEILVEEKNYDKALEVLQPFTETKSEYTLESLFKVAEIYEKQNKTELADKTYTRIYKEYPKSDYGEEAMFRSALVYYTKNDFSTAYKKFNDYIKKYSSGRFLEDSLYYSGDCALKVGEINKAIMINKNLIAKFPESLFLYNSYKNLLYCYYDAEDYESALNTASYLVENYTDQAFADNIDSELVELEKIVKGSDPRIVEKLSQFEDAGGVDTVEGRKIGSAIVKLYGENSYSHKYGYELAVKILEKITEEDNKNDAGANAEFVGDYLRAAQHNKEAAEYYLQAADFYGEINNSLKAATVLYSAAESFSAGGLKNKARDAAEMLKDLYPETKYAERVDRVVR